jgi:hypothetical protein
MRPHRVLGNSIILQRATSEPAGRKKNSAARLLMPHELAHKQDRVAIVNSVITKVFNTCKCWTVRIKPFLKNTQPFNACIVYCQFLVFDFCLFYSMLCLILCFVCLILCFCLIVQSQIIQCIFCSDTGNVFQVFWSRYTTTNRLSINIIQQTAPSLS